jgi:hypothetical protein
VIILEKIILNDTEPGMNPTSEDLSKVIVDRLGLNPRKTNSTQDMYRTFLEFYERSKQAAQQKNPELAVITVEEMAIYAKITRQTMYDYLKRWTALNFIVKTSYIKDGKVIVGYRLNGPTLEAAFDKARQRINNNLELTQKYVMELQRILKNEKISRTQKINKGESEIPAVERMGVRSQVQKTVSQSQVHQEEYYEDDESSEINDDSDNTIEDNLR